MKALHTFITGLTVMLAVGCTGMQPGLGFDDVQQSVAQRTGMQVRWNAQSPEDAEAGAAVNALLSKELTAETAVQIALLNSRELQATYEELHIAQADLVQAGLLKNPVFSGELRFDTEGAGTAAALEIGQDFISLLLSPLRKARAASAFEAAKARITGAVLDHAAETQSAFLELQASMELLEMRRTVVEATAASFDLAKRLRAAGNNRELDVANEQALFEQSKLDLALAEAVVIVQRERMNELMGLWGGQTAWSVAPRLPSIPEQEIDSVDLEQRAIERSLDLEIARNELNVAARELGLVKPLGGIDDIEIGAAAERETEGGWTVGPAVSFPIPIFDQGQAVVGASQARLRQAAERHAAAAIRVRSCVRAAYAATVAARDRSMYFQHVMLPLRQKIVDETQLHYNAMQVGAFQLLQAKRDQIDAGAEHIASLRDYWLARARLDLILSGRLPAAAVNERIDRNGSSRGSRRDEGHD